MVNETEKILSAFAQMYFFKELVQNRLQFTEQGSTEKEVADLLLNLGDIIIILTTLIISKKPGNTGISRDIRTEFTTDLLLSD